MEERLPAFDEILDELDDETVNVLLYDYTIWARPKQRLPDGDWDTCIWQCGRRFGKTWTGATIVNYWAENGVKLIALIARNPSDGAKVMIYGASGIIALAPPWNKPVYNKIEKTLKWPDKLDEKGNVIKVGCQAIMYSGENPDGVLGQGFEKAWLDELCAYAYPQATWDMLQMAMSAGKHPQVIVTTTPRSIPTLRDIKKSNRTVVIKGNTYENESNLAASYVAAMHEKYDGTTIGRQEIFAEDLQDNAGALWKRSQVDADRVELTSKLIPILPEMKRLVVAIDPAVKSKKTADEVGIIVSGLGVDNQGYCLDDLTQPKDGNEWAHTAIKAFIDI